MINAKKLINLLNKAWFCDRDGCIMSNRCDICKLNYDLIKLELKDL
jgi:hypothetical protein